MPITLTYFEMYARAEKIRMALTVCGVEFVDTRVTGDAYKAFRNESGKCEFGGLPVLELEDGTCLSQTEAILRYIENTWGKTGLQQNDDVMVVYQADKLREYFLGDFVNKSFSGLVWKKFDSEDEKKAAWDVLL
jgi:glutathione S-transferase